MVEGAKLGIMREDLWELQKKKILDGNKGGLHKNCILPDGDGRQSLGFESGCRKGFLETLAILMCGSSKLPATSPMWLKDLTNNLRRWRTPRKKPKADEVEEIVVAKVTTVSTEEEG